jgi:hypothetical protein
MKEKFLEKVNLALRSRRAREEEGQGLIELTFAVSLMAIVIVVSFEFALVFASYIALLNSARAGARYASTQPRMVEDSLSKNYATYCTEDNKDEEFCWQYGMFVKYIEDEVWAAGLDQSEVTIDNPQVDYDDLGAPLIEGGKPVTVTLHYDLTTFTSGIRMPFFGRFGLPDTYRLNASAAMPIGGE